MIRTTHPASGPGSIAGQRFTVVNKVIPATVAKAVVPLLGLLPVQQAGGAGVIQRPLSVEHGEPMQPRINRFTPGNPEARALPVAYQVAGTPPVVPPWKKGPLVPLRGRVVDDKGTPLKNALVMIQLVMKLDDTGNELRMTGRAETDADGRYETKGLPAKGHVTVTVEKPGYKYVSGGVVSISGTIPGADGAPTANPAAAFVVTDIVLQPGRERKKRGVGVDAAGNPIAKAVLVLPGAQKGSPPLRGRVIDNQGASLEDATVAIKFMTPFGDNGGQLGHEHQVNTGANGRYEVVGVPAEAQQVTVTARKTGYGFVRGGAVSISSTIQGVNGAPAPNPAAAFVATDVVLQPLGREAAGRVVDAAGKPVAKAIVVALGGGQDDEEVAGRNIARTDAEGRFKLSDLPAGEIDFVAGAGDGFVQIKSGAEALGDLVLQPQARPTRDLELARQMVLQLIKESNDTFYARQTLPDTLAPYDIQFAFDAAKMMRPDGKVDPDTLRAYVGKWIRFSPEDAREKLAALLPQLEAAGDPNRAWFTLFLMDVTRMVPQADRETLPGETEEAAAIRAWVRQAFARSSESLTKIDFQNSRDVRMAYKLVAQAALGTRLGAADADIERWVAAAIDIATRSDAAQGNGPQGTDAMSAAVAVAGLARGSARLVEKALPSVPASQRAYALGRAIPLLARTDLAGARRLLELLPLQIKPESRKNEQGLKVRIGNAEPEWAFGHAALAIIARMDAGEAAGALALARRVTSDSDRAEALALAARLQPETEAPALFREAYELATEAGGQDQPKIAGMAAATDLAVGEELMTKLEERLWEPQSNAGSIWPGDPAFYLAQTQPGRARAWLEWEWARAQNTIREVNGHHKLVNIAMAMCAVDTKRALEMADAIPPEVNADGSEDWWRHWEAQRKIAQYLSARAEVRHNLDFSGWGSGDTSTLGDEPS